MNHCKDCKHWDQSPNYDRLESGAGFCVAPKMMRGYSLFGYKLDALPEDSALVEDDEGWGIQTGSKFGCVLFEPKA